MTELSFWAALLIGLSGGIHCLGMCGGIVGAMSVAIPNDKPLLPYALAYNLGRITSYTLAGSLAGLFGQLVTFDSPAGISLLQVISAVFLLLLAAYVGGWWNALIVTEKGGKYLWRWISPLTKRFIPFRSPWTALPYGMLWGWLPCGLVYAALTWALASGDYLTGGKIMLGFGLGTLPVMLLMALGAHKIAGLLLRPWVKHGIAIMLSGYALFSLFHALRVLLPIG